MSLVQITPGNFRRNLLVAHKGQLYKLSEPYESMFSAQLMYPVPPRTTVQQFPWADGLEDFEEPSEEMVKRYDEAYGRAAE